MKTSELTGAALDWAVAKAIGEYKPVAVPHYSTNWAQGGPIIEREKIDIGTYRGAWRAAKHVSITPTYATGPTPLIAAMRCLVASKMGDDIEITKELK